MKRKPKPDRICPKCGQPKKDAEFFKVSLLREIGACKKCFHEFCDEERHFHIGSDID